MVTELPTVQVFQDFQVALSEEIPALPAFIVGPQYDFLDYDVADDKETAFIGLYDSTIDTDYGLPGFDSATILDEDAVEVIFDDLEARYFSHVAAAGPYEFHLVSGSINRIRTDATLASDELIFKEFTNRDGMVFLRSSVFLERDVQLGDVVEVSALATTLKTKVSGFVNEVIPAVTGAAAADAGNQATVAGSVGAAVADGGNTGGDTLTSSGTYSGSLEEDVLTDTYTVDIITGGLSPVFGAAVADGGNTGDDAVPLIAGSFNSVDSDVYTVEVTLGGISGVAQVTTTSVNGDNSGPTAVSGGTPFLVGSFGVTVEFASFGADLVLTLGDVWTFAVTASAALLQVTSLSGSDDDAVVAFPGFGTAFAIGTRGVLATLTFGGAAGISAGDQWTIAVVKALGAVVATSSGIYTGTNDKTYTIEVTQGGVYGSAKISVTSTSIDSSGPTTVLVAATPVSVGTQGLAIAFAANVQTGLVLGDKWTILATAEKKGAFKTLVLQDKLPAAILAAPATDLTVTLALTQQDRVISRFRLDIPGDEAWSVDTDEDTITINDGIFVDEATWFDLILGPVLLPVTFARMHVVYRALRLENCDLRRDVSTDPADIVATLGRVDPRNPLAFGVSLAAQNSAGRPIKFQAICTDDRAGYLAVWDQARDYSDVYSMVPLTQDNLVHQDLEAHVDAVSTPQLGQWRIGLINRALQTKVYVYDTRIDDEGDEVDYQMTVDDNPDVSGTQFTRLIAEDGQDVNFIVDNVVPGYVVALNFRLDADGETIWDEHEVEEVVSSTVLILTPALDAAVPVLSKFQLFRRLTKTEQAQDIATYAEAILNRRMYLFFPDVVGIAGTFVEGYYLCCAAAGMIAALPPHQGFTNFQIFGFDDLSRVFIEFTRDQIQLMADGGVYIVTQTTIGTVPFARHQLSTDTSAIEFAELSITKNVDNISYFFRNLLSPLIGVYNVTPDTLEVIYATLTSGIETLKNNIFPRIGPQLIDATIQDIQQDETFCTKVRADLGITIPCPLNTLDLHLIV